MAIYYGIYPGINEWLNACDPQSAAHNHNQCGSYCICLTDHVLLTILLANHAQNSRIIDIIDIAKHVTMIARQVRTSILLTTWLCLLSIRPQNVYDECLDDGFV